jgi:hypothetical protein
MLQFLRGHDNDAITSVGHLTLLLIAVYAHNQKVWVGCCSLIGLISLWAWAANYQRCRVISDTPTSHIASAAQGYVELYGRAAITSNNLLISPYSHTRCIWYRYRIYEKEDKGWRQVSNHTSDSMIEISDGSGSCVIDPDQAEIISPDRREVNQGGYKYVEELLRSDSVYALGEFVTIGGANSILDLNSDVAALLSTWKENKPSLLQRFDLDGNGEIDLKEWELARRAAVREVEKEHRETRATDGVHVMRAPKNGRPFLLSNLSPHKLRNTYRYWGAVHLTILFVAVAGALWFWQGHTLIELFTKMAGNVA